MGRAADGTADPRSRRGGGAPGLGRRGPRRPATGRHRRYFSLGPDAEAVADHYIRHYYGDAYFAAARADTLTSPQQIDEELDRLAAAGAIDVVLYPSSADVRQLQLAAGAVSRRLRGAPVRSAA
jgi:hypothetical protein